MYEKRHFEDLARVIKHWGTKVFHDAPEEHRATVAEVVAAVIGGLGDHFLMKSLRFDESRWYLAACPECFTGCPPLRKR